jgi:IS5 family transposase
MSRNLYQQISFADSEFQNLRQLDPTLQAISDFLDRQSELVEKVRRDLQRGLKKPGAGRAGLSASQALRSLVLMRIKNWDYRELRERIDDGVRLRTFTHFDSHAVPQHDAFNRAFVRITPPTMREINQRVILAGVDLGVEDGQMLRVDTTVVETNIHYPTDSTLLWDSVRTITRLVRAMGKVLPRGVRGFPIRTRSARRRMQEIQRMSAQQRVRQQERKYRELLRITGEVVESARGAVKQAERAQARKRAPVLDVFESAQIDQFKKEIAQYCSLAERVMDQTRRRVIDGETVPPEEKVYSIFEPHTDLIKRGKERKPVEFGHKVRLAESAQGLITDYKVLDGNPSDTNQVADTLQRHEETFSHAPEVLAGDRGFFSAENETTAKDRGVAEVCIPQRGGVKTPERTERERSAAFKRGQRFRVGIEGRISVLFRGRGMKRCLAKGRERFEILVGAAVLANNLLRIAELLKDQKTKGRKAAA